MRRCALAVLMTFAFSATASAQDPPPPPCPAGVPPNVTITGSDLEDNGGPLTATHTITLDVEADGHEIGDFKLELPPGAERRRGGPTPAFSVDAPGPVPVRVTWRELENGSECTASAETTVNIEPAKPLRYRGPKRRSGLMNSLDWSVSFGNDADLRPLELRLRGVRRARVPGPSAPLQTATFAFRRGDRGLSYDGRAIRMLRSAGWRFQLTFGHSRRDISIDMIDYPGPKKGFGIDLELVQAGRVVGRTRARGRCAYLVCRYRSVRGPSAAQAGAPACPAGEAPSATIRGFDVEDGGGQLTATHTIALEARDRDGVIPRASFTVPPGAQNRGDELNPAFSIDTPGPVPVTATWSQELQSDGSTCTATTQGTLRLRAARALTFDLLRTGPSLAESFSMGFETPKNADLRPVQLRLRGVRRARPPGTRARVQRVTLVLRRGDAGLARGEHRIMRAAGWEFRVGNVDEHSVLLNVKNLESRRGRRGRPRAFGYSVVLVQAGRRLARERVVGHCGFLGCNWRAL